MINLFIVGFRRPDLLLEQRRLFDKYLLDKFEMCLIDNTPEDEMAAQMERTCRDTGVGYQRVPAGKHRHNDALNFAALHVTRLSCEYWALLDHDIFPRQPVSLIEQIEPAGFFGIGQTHAPTGHRYLWPGIACFSKRWLNGRVPNFDGIRGAVPRDDGDCGSMMWSLFSDEEWEKMKRPEHGYGFIRPDDSFGIQSFGYEFFSGFLHLTNASHWMAVPDPNGRDRLLLEMVQKL